MWHGVFFVLTSSLNVLRPFRFREAAAVVLIITVFPRAVPLLFLIGLRIYLVRSLIISYTPVHTVSFSRGSCSSDDFSGTSCTHTAAVYNS